MKKKIKKDCGVLFWITGLSGTGKSSIGEKIFRKIKKKYGPTIIIHGDDFRRIWKLNGYSNKNRYQNSQKYINFCKYITDQNINIIFTVIGMFNKIRKWNRKNINNYVEIYIKQESIEDFKIKRKNRKNVVGLDLKPEFPKKPDIKINNNYKKSIDVLSKELLNKISKVI